MGDGLYFEELERTPQLYAVLFLAERSGVRLGGLTLACGFASHTPVIVGDVGKSRP